MNLVRRTPWLAVAIATMLITTSSICLAQREKKERGNREERSSTPSEPRAPQVETPRAPRVEPPRAPRVEPVRTLRPEPVRTPRVQPERTPRVEPVRTPRIEIPRVPRVETPREPRIEIPRAPRAEPERTPRVQPERTPRVEPIRTPRPDPIRLPRAEPDRGSESDNGNSNTGSSNRGNRNPPNVERPERTPRIPPRQGVEGVVDTPRSLPRTPRITPPRTTLPEGGRNPGTGNRGDSNLENVQRRLDQIQRNPRIRPVNPEPVVSPDLNEGVVDTPRDRGNRTERPQRTPPVRKPADRTPRDPMPEAPAVDMVNENPPRSNRPDRTPGDRAPGNPNSGDRTPRDRNPGDNTPAENVAGDNEPNRRPGGRLRNGEEVLPPAERPARVVRPGRGENRDNRGDKTPDENPQTVVGDQPNKADKPDRPARPDRVPGTRLPGNRLPDNEVVRLPENRVDKETRAVIDRLDRQAERLRIPVNLTRNGQLRDVKLADNVTQQLRRIERARTADDLTDQLRLLRNADQQQLRDLRLDRNSGFFQARLIDNDFRDLQRSRLGRQINLDRQFEFYRRGDVARRLGLFGGLNNNLVWANRNFRGPIYRDFTRASFSFWYAGPGFYPRYTWLPRWSPWVDWSWWNNAGPLYDPRPIYCRPVIYEPAPVWTYYEYPTWQALPQVAAGTWVDLPEVAPVPEPDFRLTAVRFVDGGHPDQDLGPRFRVWVQNSSSQDWTGDFSVLLMAANDELPPAEPLQAGITMTQLAAGEIQSVDIRLPIEVSEMQETDGGQLGPFEFLHVLVDANDQVPEHDETNNGTVIARVDVPPVDPATFSTDSQSAAAGALVTLAGEGYGPEPGQVVVIVDGKQYDAEIYGWYDLGVRFAVPEVNSPSVTAEILVIRGDGAASNPISLDLVEASQFDQAPVNLK